MRSKLRRVSVLVLVVITLAMIASFVRARQTVHDIVGAPSAAFTPVREGFLPFGRDFDGRWTWVFSFGPADTPGHVGIQLFVPFGRGPVSANPADALARIRTWRALHER